MNTKSHMRKARGLIVMASTDTSTQTLIVPIPRFVHNAAFDRDVADARAALTAYGPVAKEQRLALLTSFFLKTWTERNGTQIAADQKTPDDILVWGNLLIDEVPLGHYVIVQHEGGFVPFEIMVAPRAVFMKWIDCKLSTLIGQVRNETAAPACGEPDLQTPGAPLTLH